MKAVALIAAVGALMLSTTSSASTSQPKLRILDRTPLTVRGTSFEARERVRVTATADGIVAVRVRASAAGVFTATFETLSPTRCDTVRVVAVGAQGSRAVLKLLPAPGCIPA